ncbi:hypothetical protein ACVMAJ_000118 [Bradyrhizobium sp. USDA 4448]
MTKDLNREQDLATRFELQLGGARTAFDSGCVFTSRAGAATDYDLVKLLAECARRDERISELMRLTLASAQGPDPRRALWPAVIIAQTGRTHGCSDQSCDVKILLANPEPSTPTALLCPITKR